MYNAPAVSFSLGRSRFHGLLLALVSGAGACCLLLWVRQTGVPAATQLAAVVLWLLGTGLASSQWWSSPSGTLTWDGRLWSWAAAGRSVTAQLQVVFDGQEVLVLCLLTQIGQRIWLWPQRPMDPTHWLALRRAVFAPQPAPQQRDLGVGAP
ncbi:hypothetical protein GALL_406930 [mine drainage metagenome]|uniref:Toxin CptA n=1 Tax=mine drainage metagenome TaxID=410659 RepID=A0A1J5QCA3_9ZZZZ